MSATTGPDWLAARVWDEVRDCAIGLVRDHDRHHDDVRRATRDMFHALFVATPRPWADPADSDASDYARRVRGLIDSAQFGALHTITVGDEDAVLNWLPTVVGAFCEGAPTQASAPQPAAGRPSTLGSGDDGGRSVSTNADGWEPADARVVASRTGPVTASQPAEGLPEPEVLAALVDAAATQDLHDLVAACRAGVRRHIGIDAGRDPHRMESPGTTRDLSRVRPEAWDRLATDAGEALLWDRWARIGLPSRPEPARNSRAPLIVVVDESGSMELLLDRRNSRRTWSKALVLACLAICSEQRRDLLYVGYSCADQLWTCRLAGDGASTAEVAEVCAHFFGGDTDLKAPLGYLMTVLANDTGPCSGSQGSDVLLLSDGDCVLDDPAIVLDWNEALRKSGSHCWGIRIGERDDPGSTAMLDDLCHAACDLEAFGEDAMAQRFSSLRRQVRHGRGRGRGRR